jgi:hypothetical protein
LQRKVNTAVKNSGKKGDSGDVANEGRSESSGASGSFMEQLSKLSQQRTNPT